MNKQELKQIKEWFTIEKMEFSFFKQKMENKKHKFFTKDYLPPMWLDLLNKERKDYGKGVLIGFKKNLIPESVAIRFAENIKYQAEILRIIKKRVEKFKYRCGIIKAKTGKGKSIITMDIIEYLQTTTLVLVTNKKLMQEMMDKFGEMTNIEPSQYGDGKKNIGFITIMTKSSFLTCPDELLSDFDSVIIDECHQGFSKKFRDKFNTAFHKKQIYLYGLSATPSTVDLDECDLEKYFGKIIEIKEEYDFIPSFTFYNYQHNEDSEFLFNDEETGESYMKKIYEFEHYAELRGNMGEDKHRIQEQRKVISTNLSDKCSLILCDRIAEMDLWEEYFEIYDEYNIIVIKGDTKITDDKRQLEEALISNKPIIIIGSISKCSTGFDFPIISSVFIFSSIKFQNTVIQSIGRSLRKSPGKTGSKIYVWNDHILQKQKIQKQSVILEEYKIDKKDIVQIDINKHRKKKGEIALEF